VLLVPLPTSVNIPFFLFVWLQINGPNVYPGVPHDYTKQDVTPENFLNILQGNAEAMAGIGSGKVIRRWVRYVHTLHYTNMHE